VVVDEHHPGRAGAPGQLTRVGHPEVVGTPRERGERGYLFFRHAKPSRPAGALAGRARLYARPESAASAWVARQPPKSIPSFPMRDAGGRLVPTKQGRAVLDAMVG
jgi:hypothetical protein